MLIRISITLVLISINISYAQQYWLQKPSPATKNLTRIQFVDTLFGWAAGDFGTIIHTTNGGLNWTVQNTGANTYPIDDMFFLNRTLGWAVGNDVYFSGSKIFKTTNGGTNWHISVFPDTTVIFSVVYFNDSLNGYLSGFTGQIYKTTDGGGNWYRCRLDTGLCNLYEFPKFNINFLNSQTGFACGGHMDLQGIIWKTTDSGMNWFTYCISPEPIKRIKALYPFKTQSTGGDYEYGAITVQSLDSGKTWLYDTTRFFGIGTALAYRTPEELWVPLSIDSNWALNLDSGGYQTTWYKIRTPLNTYIYDAMFVTPYFGWACGLNGVLLKYNSDIIGIAENGNMLPENNSLFQNYPNPFNPTTTISYFLSGRSFIKITIYDLLGKEVKKYVEGLRNPGLHKFSFSAFNLASGIYIYKIEAGSFIDVKKMVLLK